MLSGSPGFSEELITEAILIEKDKHGFIRKTVKDADTNDISERSFEVASFTIENSDDATKSDVFLVAMNVPEGADVYYGFFKPNAEYQYDIGEQADMGQYFSFIGYDINLALGCDLALNGGSTTCYHVYAVGIDNIILAKAKIEVEVPVRQIST